MNNPKYQHTVVLSDELEQVWRGYRRVVPLATFNGLVCRLLRQEFGLDKSEQTMAEDAIQP